jgi:hypothetical protein
VKIVSHEAPGADALLVSSAAEIVSLAAQAGAALGIDELQFLMWARSPSGKAR